MHDELRSHDMTTDVIYNDRPKRIENCSRAILVIVIAALFIGTVNVAESYFRLGDSRDMVLEGRINPNTAGIGSLVNLKGIGPSRAKAIIEYRQLSGKAAFTCSEDIQKIKGIGPKTGSAMSQWLYFD